MMAPAATALGLDVTVERITETTSVVQVNGDTGKWLRIVARGHKNNFYAAHYLACSLGYRTRSIPYKAFPEILKLLRTQ